MKLTLCSVMMLCSLFTASILNPSSAHAAQSCGNGTIEGNDPKHQVLFRASADLGRKVDLDSTFRFVSQLPAPPVPSYAEVDQRIGWFVTPRIELSLVGRNLVHAHHPEYGPPSPAREEAERNVYARVALRF